MNMKRGPWIRLTLEEYKVYARLVGRLTGRRFPPLDPPPRTGYIEVPLQNTPASKRLLERERRRRLRAGEPRASRGQIVADVFGWAARMLDEAGPEKRKRLIAYLTARADSTPQEMDALLKALKEAC